MTELTPAVRQKIENLLAAYKSAMESQNTNGPDAKLAVMANYAELALSLLAQIHENAPTDNAVKTETTMFSHPQNGMTGIGSISAPLNGKPQHFAKLTIFEETPVEVSLVLPSAYRKNLTLEAAQTLQAVCGEIATLITTAHKK